MKCNKNYSKCKKTFAPRIDFWARRGYYKLTQYVRNGGGKVVRNQCPQT
nr:MAG TPA: hypothetical protein [Caudoviricetes sp.]DAV98112.1 MAG TPA: hypothetical protein [Caudoviricetes sp.]